MISTTELNFEFFTENVIVSSKICFYKNSKVANVCDKLFLNGVDLELIAILIDGKQASYTSAEDGVWLNNLSNEFVLEVKTRIYPHNNTSLEGLYRSGHNFCTQCEAHGFRRITYYLDRPDVLSVFTTSIKADYKMYPVLLSNGNLLSKNKGTVKWHDPYPKPCYLFALVVGNFVVFKDYFITKSANKVELKIYVEQHNINKTYFAMQSLKKSFAWDEKRFQLEYDLDTYMIVVVDDFNMGAMENKGLNIFNSACVLADMHTATDDDFINIEATIAHEYFHNWSGNRVTCRDWFQLSLKEGLTVFREQEFIADTYSRSIKRIEDVARLINFQFVEDSGSLAHPVRPDSYIEMNNFYTFTVYEKGAELIRMLHVILGETNFQKGMKLYFKRHDQTAVTIDDFVASMGQANNFDFSHFMLWYSQKGTPQIKIDSYYDVQTKIYKVVIEQQGSIAFYFPLSYGLLSSSGNEIRRGVLIVDSLKKTYKFNNVDSKPIPSWLRGFSAPVKLNTDLSFKDKIFLITYDNDAFNRWYNAQELWIALILTPSKVDERALFQAFKSIIKNGDNALISRMLTLPTDSVLYLQVAKINVVKIRDKKELVIKNIIKYLGHILLDTYNKLAGDVKYQLTPSALGNRELKNICLYYLVKGGNFSLAYKQFSNANCFSDKFSSFNTLLSVDNPYKDIIISEFFATYKKDTQVMDKWFAAQAQAPSGNVVCVQRLMMHELFSYNNPNRLRAVVSSFSRNFINFHNKQGYQLLTKVIIRLNTTNPQIAARLVTAYNNWRRYGEGLDKLQKQQLVKIVAIDNLSKDVFEIANSALNIDTKP